MSERSVPSEMAAYWLTPAGVQFVCRSDAARRKTWEAVRDLRRHRHLLRAYLPESEHPSRLLHLRPHPHPGLAQPVERRSTRAASRVPQGHNFSRTQTKAEHTHKVDY